MRRDWPDYSVTEYVLCGLFLGGAVVCLIVAGHAWATDAPLDALESAGAGLLLLGGSVDPVRYVVDTLSFPWHATEPAGARHLAHAHRRGPGPDAVAGRHGRQLADLKETPAWTCCPPCSPRAPPSTPSSSPRWCWR